MLTQKHNDPLQSEHQQGVVKTYAYTQITDRTRQHLDHISVSLVTPTIMHRERIYILKKNSVA
jgi:hypothetical protein